MNCMCAITSTIEIICSRLFKHFKKMDIFTIVLLVTFATGFAQHEDIPYENVENICQKCVCINETDGHHILSCTMVGFQHILPRWPEDFVASAKGNVIEASFSGNTIEILQQLPTTNATLSFACRHCGIKYLQSPTFMDVPNIVSLDLAFNEITTDELTPDVFRGPYHLKSYESIALMELDLSHNKLNSLDRVVFQHAPNLTKLSLAFNNLEVLDNPTTIALSSATLLQNLDLSHTGIKSISSILFQKLTALRTLNLADNKFVQLPDDMQLSGKSLKSLNLAGNWFQHFDEKSFLALKVLTQLNISDMPSLKSIEKNTFSPLENLEHLDCAHNPKMEKFDFASLLHCTNLTYLDLSYNHLSTLSVDMDLSASLNATNVTSNPWPKLKTFSIIANPWACDCDLFLTLEYVGSHHHMDGNQARCETPYIFAGAKLSNLNSTQVCSMQIPTKYQVIDEDPPRFRRKRYIILTVITASVVVVLGLMIGFIVVCIRRRLKRDDFGVEPIRYTSVRSSNLSAAFSHGHVNGGASNIGTGAV